jgi:hypothetical protein
VFANATALTVFLPLGLVLRCFFATRKVGGALISIAVGLYLVFPLALSLNALVSQQLGEDTLAPLMDVFSQAEQLSLWENFQNPGDLVTPDNWTAYISEFNGAAQSLVSAVANLPVILTTAVYTLLVQIVFLPLISIAITLIAIKELAGLFGSELNLSRFEVL